MLFCSHIQPTHSLIHANLREGTRRENKARNYGATDIDLQPPSRPVKPVKILKLGKRSTFTSNKIQAITWMKSTMDHILQLIYQQ